MMSNDMLDWLYQTGLNEDKGLTLSVYSINSMSTLNMTRVSLR